MIERSTQGIKMKNRHHESTLLLSCGPNDSCEFRSKCAFATMIAIELHDFVRMSCGSHTKTSDFCSQYDNHTTASIVKWNRLKTLHRYLKFKHISNCLKVCFDSTSAIYESRVVPPWEIISVLTAEVYHGSGSYYITAYSHCKT